MIRLSVILGIIGLTLIGARLFHISQAVQLKEDRLVQLHQEIRMEKDKIHVLQAEWHYLNQPQRLQSLAEKYLNLRATDRAQVARIKLPSTPKIYAQVNLRPKQKPAIRPSLVELGMQMALKNTDDQGGN